MKKFIVLPFIVFLFTACPPDGNRTLESVDCYTVERNFSTRDVFIQYYLNNGNITRKKIYKSTENRIHSLQDDYIKMDEMYKNNYCSSPDPDPQFTYANPNKVVKKILIIDIDSNKIIKRIEDPKSLYFLGYADDNYDMKTRFEYWFLDITDEWLMTR